MKGNWIRKSMAVLFGVLFAFGILISLLSGQAHEVDSSAAANHPLGRRAALLVLEELGHEAQAWQQAPIFLEGSEGLLWMPQTPVLFELATDDSDGDEAIEPGEMSAEDPRHPMHYGEFVRAGGTLLLPYSESNLEWLREDCGLEVPDWPRTSTTSTWNLELDTGETLSASLLSRSQTDDGPVDVAEHEAAGWHDIAWGEAGQPFASWAQVAYGRVAFVANDSFMDNDRLGDFDNGLLLARIVEALDAPGPTLFDEYALGLWVPPRTSELLFTPGLIEVTYHALLAFLFFVALHAWVREFPRDAPEARLSPRLRVQSQAALLMRADRLDLLALDLKLGVLMRVARRLGLRTPDPKLDPRARLRTLQHEFRERAPQSLEFQQWEALHANDDVEDRNTLEQLGHELREFEERAQSLASHRPLATRTS